MHNNRVDSDVLHQHDIQGKVVFQLLGNHGIASIFYDDDFVIKLLDVRQRLEKDFCFLYAFFHGVG